MAAAVQYNWRVENHRSKQALFELPETELQKITSDAGLQAVLKQRYPKLTQAATTVSWLGLLKFLCAEGAITGGVRNYNDFVIEQNHLTGTDGSGTGVSAWDQYREYMLSHLEQYNDDVDLASAREDVRDDIINHYINYAPNWPKIGQESKVFTYDIRKGGQEPKIIKKIRLNPVHIWSCYGMINMQDYREEEKVFHAKVWSNQNGITFKRISLMLRELHRLERKSQDEIDELVYDWDGKSIEDVRKRFIEINSA